MDLAPYKKFGIQKEAHLASAHNEGHNRANRNMDNQRELPARNNCKNGIQGNTCNPCGCGKNIGLILTRK